MVPLQSFAHDSWSWLADLLYSHLITFWTFEDLLEEGDYQHGGLFLDCVDTARCLLRRPKGLKDGGV